MGSAEQQSQRSPCGRGMADSRARRLVCTAIWAASLGWSRMPTGLGGDRSRRRPLPGVGPRTRRRKLLDQSVAGYTEVTWAEDRATRGRDPSAEPGAKTGVGGRTPPLGIPGIGRKAINPITSICISEWRSENQGLSRARRAGKVAGSKAIMPGCMRFWRTTAGLMVLQKRPCFCSPAGGQTYVDSRAYFATPPPWSAHRMSPTGGFSSGRVQCSRA